MPDYSWDTGYWIDFLAVFELAAMIELYVSTDNADVKSAVWQVLYHSRVENDWIADARHFKWNPMGGRRPDSKYLFYGDWAKTQSS
tara:strand:+ start:468 stop:725 length:258 start_codon:yes stop_codon:yes gene_type:complete